MSVTVDLAERLDGLLGTDLKKDGRLGKVRRYLRGEHDDPYTPKGAKAEFRHLAKRAVTNWLPLISDSYSRALFVDGYRVPRGDSNVEAWKAWQANALDARQSIVHRGALEYGTAYVLVLPGKGTPVIKCLSPLTTMAWYDEDDDEFPRYVLTRTGQDIGGNDLFDVYDDTSRYRFRREDGQTRLYAREDHGLGVTPVVRFRDRLDGECVGLIRPVIPLQDRINETIFSTLIAMQYASFRQRWATGLAIPVVEDEDSPDYGQPVEPFDAAVNRLWVSDDSEAKFGDFAQTDIRGHLELYDGTIRTLAATAQISPNVLTGDLVNISAEALAQMESATQRRLDEYKVLFGEAWEQVFRLVALAAGQPLPDEAAEVRWRDTEARSLTATVEALGILASALGVPAEALWEKIPGVSDSELLRWKALVKTDPMDRLTDEIVRQTARAGDTLAEAATPAPPPATAEPAAA